LIERAGASGRERIEKRGDQRREKGVLKRLLKICKRKETQGAWRTIKVTLGRKTGASEGKGSKTSGTKADRSPSIMGEKSLARSANKGSPAKEQTAEKRGRRGDIPLRKGSDRSNKMRCRVREEKVVKTKKKNQRKKAIGARAKYFSERREIQWGKETAGGTDREQQQTRVI